MMMGLGYSGLGMVLLILVWAAIIVVAIWALGKLFPQVTGFTAPSSRDRSGETAESPLDILKRRFARGELSQAEYDEMRRKLFE